MRFAVVTTIIAKDKNVAKIALGKFTGAPSIYNIYVRAVVLEQSSTSISLSRHKVFNLVIFLFCFQSNLILKNRGCTIFR